MEQDRTATTPSRLAGVLVVEAGLLTLFYFSGSVMGSVQLTDFAVWLKTSDPSTVFTALVRLLGLGLASWLVLTTVFYGLAGRSKSPRLRKHAGQLTAAPLRRLLDGAAAVSIVASAVTTLSTSASAAAGPTPTTVVAPPDKVAISPPQGAGHTSATENSVIANRHFPHPVDLEHDSPPASGAPVSRGSPDDAWATRFRSGDRVYVVRPGDCLSVIADRYLGDWRRDEEIDQLNRGRLQPDGRRLWDDHWIYPGWHLLLPVDAHDVPHWSPAADPAQAALGAGPSMPDRQASAAPATASRQPPESIPTPTESDEHGVARPTGGRHAPAAEAGLIGMVAAGFVWTLARRRRERMHARPTGQRVVRNGPTVERVVAAAHVQARECPEQLVRLDLALRLISLRTSQGGTAPEVVLVRSTPQELELLVDPPEPSAPTHFESVDDGSVWILDPEASSAELQLSAGDAMPIAPALVSLGEARGATVLFNLEHAGALSVSGDPEAVRAVMNGIRLEMLTQPWAEEALEELTVLAFDDSTSAASLEERVGRLVRTAAAGQVEQVGDQLRSGQSGDGSSWRPRVVLVPQTLPPLLETALVAAAQVPYSRLCVVLAAPRQPGPWALDVSGGDTGRLRGLLGGASFELDLTLRRDSDALDALTSALASPLGPEPWAESEPRAGGSPPLGGGPPEAPDRYWDVNDLDESELEVLESDSEFGELSVDDDEDLRETDPQLVAFLDERSGIRPSVPIGLPESTDGRPVELSLLGPVRLRGADLDHVPANRRAAALSVLSYLAVRNRPVSADELSVALWPVDESKDGFGEPRRKTVMNVISRARSLLGPTADGGPRLILGEGGYSLHSDVSCDWRRFEDSTQGTASLSDLRSALEMVEGPPFAGSLANPFYEWVSAQHLDLAMTAAVVDTAERLARSALHAADYGLVEWAVRKGLDLDPAREELYQVWMHAAGEVGRLDQVEEIYRRLCRAIQRHIDAGLSPKEESQEVRQRYLSRRSTRV